MAPLSTFFKLFQPTSLIANVAGAFKKPAVPSIPQSTQPSLPVSNNSASTPMTSAIPKISGGPMTSASAPMTQANPSASTIQLQTEAQNMEKYGSPIGPTPMVTPKPAVAPTTQLAPIIPNVQQTSDGQNINPATGGVKTPIVPEVAKLSPYDTAAQDVEKYMQPSEEENTAAKQLADINESLRQGYIGEGDRPIALPFITGRQKSLETRAATLSEPIKAQAALAQAKRTAALEASKFKLSTEKDKLSAEAEANKPVSLAQGSRLINPATGKIIAEGAQTSNQDATRVLSASEAQLLGVPFGTTAGEAYGITPNKPLTEAQGKDLTYAARSGEANDVINNYESTVSKYNPAVWAAYKAAESNTIGNAYVPDEVRQIRQAERNFATAVLRRESGAAISASEFTTVERQYFPRPGDDAKTLQQKAQNRQTAINSFLLSSGKGNTPTGGAGETGNEGFNW